MGWERNMENRGLHLVPTWPPKGPMAIAGPGAGMSHLGVIWCFHWHSVLFLYTDTMCRMSVQPPFGP